MGHCDVKYFLMMFFCIEGIGYLALAQSDLNLKCGPYGQVGRTPWTDGRSFAMPPCIQDNTNTE
jgi:hypothetical protein